MSEELFRVVFDGEIAWGFTDAEVRENLQRLCKLDGAAMEKVFSGRPFVFKARVDRATAERYKEALDRTGARCRIEPMSAAPAVAPATAPPAAVPVAEKKPGGFTCPKCGHPQEPGLTCVACGIVFEKYRRAQERAAAGIPPGPPPGSAASAAPSAVGEGSEVGYFARHQEQAFILKAFGMIAAILLLRGFLSGTFVVLAFFLFPVVFLVFIRLQAAVEGQNPSEVLAQHITFMPVMYTEGERKKEGVAAVTYSLIAANIVIFYGWEIWADPEFLGNFLFLPENINAWNVPVSAFTSMFLHAGNGHLWGNMTFLWAVGTVVERRVGHKRFLALYLLTGLAAGLFGVVAHRLFLGQTLHGLGASGAIAGVMGIFAVRCYFKSMVFPLPILGIFSLIFPVSLKVRLNSLVIIGLFFLADLGGGIAQAAGSSESNVGHWIHIGGMLAGIGLALFLKLGDQAIDERHMEIGTQAMAGGKVALGTGEESLRVALQRNPDNADAALMLARIQSKYSATEEGGELFRRAIALLIDTRPAEATAAFKEYFQKYLKGMDGEVQYRLAAAYFKQKDLEMASRSLEMICRDGQTPPPLKEKALFQCARVYEAMGFQEAAVELYAQFVSSFPASPHLPLARAKLGAG